MKLFILAVSIRWLYAATVFLIFGNDGLQTLDSTTYIANAISGHVDTTTMPLFATALRSYAMIFGSHIQLSWVLTQGTIDATTCWFLYRINPYAGWAAAFNPTQIVLSGLVLTDTLFLLFVTILLWAVINWLEHQKWSYVFLIGVAFANAALTRAMIVPWILFLLPFLFVMRRRPLQIMTIAAIFALSIIQPIWWNVRNYGALALTSQTGVHFAYSIVPLVRGDTDGTPYFKVFNNPFEESLRLESEAWRKLWQLGPLAIAEAWEKGAIINMVSPAITMSPLVSNLPHKSFYATPEPKIYNFLTENGLYSWLLIAATIMLLLVRLIQLRAWKLLPHDISFLFAAWIIYVLIITGPVASPKYRLPIEPVLMILTGVFINEIRFNHRAGAKRIWKHRGNRQTHSTTLR